MTEYLVLRGALEHGAHVEVIGPLEASSEAQAISEAARTRKAGGAYSAFPLTAASLAHVRKQVAETFVVEPTVPVGV